MRKRTWARWTAVALVLLVAAVAFAGVTKAWGGGEPKAAIDASVLRLATTTSVNDTGLLKNQVEPAFETRFPGIDLQWVSVGSGAALAAGRDGNADVVIAHAPTNEKQLVAEGHFTMRLPFAYNYFTVVGKKSDPAGVKTATSAAQAFKRIAAWGKTLAAGKVAFVSRGDNSGTNQKEMELWAKAGVTIDTANPPSWYVSAGSGMLATLQVAAEKKAYTMTDVATWIKNKTSASLSPPLYRLVTTRKDLKNQYSILLVNQTDHPDVNSTGAEFLAELLVSRNGQQLIGDYKMLGTTMFYPDSYTIANSVLPPAASPSPAPAP
jgi:tungstate transport system substrate-binding protein